MKARLLTVLSGVILCAGVASADPITVGFFRITGNANDNVESQLSCVISDAGAGQVNFRFLNNVGTAASITDVYFDDGTLLGIASVGSSAGVSFSQFADPGNLPGGNNASPPFVTTAGFSADSDPPASANGVNAASEWLDITFNLINGQTFANTIAALESGLLRIGLHVQAIGAQGESDGFINTPPVPIPLPAASAMGLASLMGLSLVRRRR